MTGATADMFTALEDHDLDALAEALEAGADCRALLADWPRWTALHVAVDEIAQGGSLDALVVLLRAGTPVDLRDGESDMTPLLMAVHRDRTDAVRLLLTAGADPCEVSSEGDSPLRLAVERGQRDLAALLLRTGAGRTIDEARGPSGMSALGRAAFELDLAMIELLLAHGARRDTLDVDRLVARDRLPERNASNASAWDAAAARLTP